MQAKICTIFVLYMFAPIFEDFVKSKPNQFSKSYNPKIRMSCNHQQNIQEKVQSNIKYDTSWFGPYTMISIHDKSHPPSVFPVSHLQNVVGTGSELSFTYRDYANTRFAMIHMPSLPGRLFDENHISMHLILEDCSHSIYYLTDALDNINIMCSDDVNLPK
mmetsp:Transcript_25519/g.58871  ORF Transcript_25519/g.58871 Transcript_25519/m.58871 type:complete len:161 (-) Transcript_25519:2654-3136(-)